MCFALIIALVAASLSGCNLFGAQGEPTATPPPPPTETPLPALPTLTPTPTAASPTATPTAVVDPDKPEQPTITPTVVSAQGQPPVGGSGAQPGEGAQEVSYVVTSVPVMGDVVRNNSFEDGFGENGVANEWTAFENGSSVYAWVDEMDPMNVSHDSHAQLMRIMGPTQPDRYVGIYQTVDVVAGEVYTLAMHGIIRSSTASDPNAHYGHRMQWAIDYEGNANWQAVEEWHDTGWNDIRLDKSDPTMNYIQLPITAQSDKLTIFVRGWSKWPIMTSEAKYYVDGVFLKGPVPGEEEVVKVVSSTGDQGGMPTTGGSAIWLPIVGALFVIGFALWEIRRTRARSA
jgi:hypothetical protein